MNEFHGWLVVREKYDGYCTDTIKLMSVVREIEKRIEDFYFDNCFVDIKLMYEYYHLIVSGETKRKGIEIESVMELFKYVSIAAPGSYGLLYTRDEYDESSYEFKVYRIARGIIEERRDPFLSPCIPTIEE